MECPCCGDELTKVSRHMLHHDHNPFCPLSTDVYDEDTWERIKAAINCRSLADTARMDWLETQSCWIGIYGEFETKCKRSAGGMYRMTVRDACDSCIPNAHPHGTAAPAGTVQGDVGRDG